MSISENIISPLGKCPRGSACWENACWGTVLEPLKTKAKMLFISTISQTKTVMKHRTKMDWNKLSIKKETNMLERFPLLLFGSSVFEFAMQDSHPSLY